MNPFTNPRVAMGLEIPGDELVRIPARDWQAMKLALWRSQRLWEIAEREAQNLIDRAAHMTGCPGEKSESEPCMKDCPDRELRMSALVIKNSGRTLAPADARKPADERYFAPTREYFSEVLATLAAAQVEIERLRAATADTPLPPPSLGEDQR